MESMIEQRVRNFRLDSRLRRACEGEIYDTCAYLGDVDTLSDYDSVVINCLQVGVRHQQLDTVVIHDGVNLLACSRFMMGLASSHVA